MAENTIPPTSSRPEEWLAWMSDQPRFCEAIDTTVAAEVHYQLVAFLVGKWEAERHQDQVSERFETLRTQALAAVR